MDIAAQAATYSHQAGLVFGGLPGDFTSSIPDTKAAKPYTVPGQNEGAGDSQHLFHGQHDRQALTNSKLLVEHQMQNQGLTSIGAPIQGGFRKEAGNMSQNIPYQQ